MKNSQSLATAIADTLSCTKLKRGQGRRYSTAYAQMQKH